MRAALAVVVALAISVAAAGCHRSAPSPASEASTSTPPGISVGSPVDITFLENMVIHHQQALELAAMVPAQSADPQLVTLAGRIAAQQRTELQGCEAQLLQWEAQPGAHDAEADIPGMVDPATMDKLRGLRGRAAAAPRRGRSRNRRRGWE